MRFSVYQESQIGGRKINQDRMGYCFTRDALLLIVADGMGGHIMGEMAATLTLQVLGNLFQQQAKSGITSPERFLEESFMAAHREIHRYKSINNLPDTPRTTLVACLIQNGMAYWAHCGDSRLYCIRHGELLLRTRDHSRIETLIAQGVVPASERSTHPDRNKLFNCLGGAHLPKVEISRRISLQPGDVILLCSDGLWSVLPEEEIVQSLREQTIVRALPEMLDKAVTTAGKMADNATALAIMWEGGQENDDVIPAVGAHFLPVNSVTTTIQPVLPANELVAAPKDKDGAGETSFDDQDIEKAIEEIRNAIHNASRLGVKE